MAFKCPPEFLLRSKTTKRPSELRVRDVSDAGGTYRAAVCTELGQPLEIQRMPRKAVLARDQVRVSVRRVSLNYGDLLQTMGLYQEKTKPPFVPGSEFTGIVVEVGEAVKSLRPGDRVARSITTSFGDGLAEEIVITEQALLKLPDDISLDTGACSIFPYSTGLVALLERGNVKPGDIVLVTAAAGATGLAAVDLAANYFKAKVIGCAGGPEKCALVKQYGAYGTVDYNKENIKEKVLQITGGKRVDVVYELVGGDVFKECLRCCGFNSRLLVIGFTSGDIPKVPANLLLVKSMSLHGFFASSFCKLWPEKAAEYIANVIELIRNGTLRPHIHKRVFALSEINEATECVLARESVGKVMIDITK